jgi:hypothetical protein
MGPRRFRPSSAGRLMITGGEAGMYAVVRRTLGSTDGTRPQESAMGRDPS